MEIVDTSVTTSKKILVDDIGTALGATAAEVNAMTSTNTCLTPASNPTVLGTQTDANTGTSVTVASGLPSGVRSMEIMLDSVSIDSTDDLILQLVDSGGAETSGYVSQACDGGTPATATNGFLITDGVAAARTYSGSITLSLMNSSTNKWVAKGNINADTGAAVAFYCSGIKSLSGVITGVILTTTAGTANFDGSGTVNYQAKR